MKALLTFCAVVLLSLWLADCTAPKSAANTAASDPDAPARAKTLESLKREIAGKENWPADSVYQNVKTLKKVNAERFLGLMDRWGQALGVGCDHCHVKNEWASEVKKEKEITRQMIELNARINRDLKSIGGIGSEDPSVSCFTCHRGNTTPRRNPG
ncbi:MAG: c-type cytochrome [Thermoanaerobaculia bacterium]|nr:c-type cytochrome [Thermoanaerobaculia bacterium]